MNIVSTLNLWLSRLYKTAAILLVLLAVIISACRLLLPHIHHYKLHVQDYINSKSQANITIGTLSMKWQQSGPVLLLDEVVILDSENATVSVKQLELQVDFWQTLSQQKLISKDLILSGVKVDLSEALWRSNSLADGQAVTDNQYAGKDINADIDALSYLFLNRIKRFSVRDSLITIRKESAVSSVNISQMQWLNTAQRHQAQGSVVFNGVSSNNLRVNVDLLGDSLTSLTGNVFLQANHIDITPWLGNLLVANNNETATDINFSAWLSLENSYAERLQVNFTQSSLNWLLAEKPQQLTLQAGQLLLMKDELTHDFTVFSSPLVWQLNDQAPIEFTSQFSQDNNDYTFYLSNIELAMLSPLSPLFIMEQATRNKLAALQLTGNVEEFFIRKQQDKLQVLADITKLSSRYSNGIPGIENVSGNLSYVDQHLVLDFQAEQGELDFDNLFVAAFPYQKISAGVIATFNENDWLLAINDLELNSEVIDISAELGMSVPASGDAHLSLLANISNADASLVGRYLPLPLMSDNLVDYLNSALISGRVDDAQVLINGPLRRFPFTDGSGIFVVDAELSEAEFKFAEHWPSITDFFANLNFTNNSMLITGRSGSLTGIDVTGVTAAIADLGSQAVLDVDAKINTTKTDYIAALMNQSSLQASVGSVLKQLNLKGEVSGDFQLNLPLQGDAQALATGNINFAGNQARLKTPEMHFSDIFGQLSFSNNKITTQNLQLVWQELPLQLFVQGGNKKDYYDTNIELTGQWQESEWLNHIPDKLKAYTQGNLDWQGEVSLYHHHKGGFSYQAQFDSDLNSTQFNLPAPYAKSIDQVKPLVVEIDGQMTQSNVRVSLADELQFSGVLTHDKTVFTRANLMLGQGKMALPSDGFHITTNLANADFASWQSLISDIIVSASPSKVDALNKNDLTSEHGLFPKPKRIRGSVDQLAIGEQRLNNLSFNLLDKQDWWRLEINAKETRGQIKIYPDWLEQGVDVNAEFLNIQLVNKKEPLAEKTIEPKIGININNNTSEREQELTNNTESKVPHKNATKIKTEVSNNHIFANIPPITFHCDSCIIDNLNLGEVDAKIERVDQETIVLSDFLAKRGKSLLTLSGQWRHNQQESESSLIADLFIEDIETELLALDYDSIIKDSGANINLDLNWQGGFHNFDIEQLNGNVSGRLDDGYLADINDKARVFSVLSLQSLLRKLTLDFRDIFSDGMFYSSIQGDYQLQQGVVTTNNTEMKGTAGDLFMKGHTNLISGDLHYDLSYKPNLTSSLPVLAWIASSANPVFFAAGVAIDQVIKSQVVSEFLFELSGTIADPIFEEVERKSKNISVDSPKSPQSVDEGQVSGQKSSILLKGEVANG